MKIQEVESLTCRILGLIAVVAFVGFLLQTCAGSGGAP